MCDNNFWYNESPQVLSKQVKYWRKEKRLHKTKSDNTNKNFYYLKNIFQIIDSGKSINKQVQKETEDELKSFHCLQNLQEDN